MKTLSLIEGDNSPEAIALRLKQREEYYSRHKIRVIKVAHDPNYDLECDLCGKVFGRADGDLNCCIFVCKKCCSK